MSTEEEFICLKCGRRAALLTAEPMGQMVFGERERDKIICADCSREMDRKPWSVQG
jgi:DNA-directed RNA polymerase subunit RPC12/RpoP